MTFLTINLWTSAQAANPDRFMQVLLVRQTLCLSSLQRMGRWESNINVWFPFIYSQKWNCYFQNRIIMFCLPVPSRIYLWEIYLFPGSVCLFCCMEICGLILGIYKSLTDTWMWKLGLRPRNSRKGILKGTQDWVFFLLRFWNLRYFFVSYA